MSIPPKIDYIYIFFEIRDATSESSSPLSVPRSLREAASDEEDDEDKDEDNSGDLVSSGFETSSIKISNVDITLDSSLMVTDNNHPVTTLPRDQNK